jgi:HK97 gp10 family phage protein
MGPSSKSRNAIPQEFGTERMQANPFMRPAWDQEKDGALQIIRDELGNEIASAAARLAKKKAKAGL